MCPTPRGGWRCIGLMSQRGRMPCSTTRWLSDWPGRGAARSSPPRRADCATAGGWWLVARTKVIDDLIAEAIADGCDRVLNLAAGLDTRPYRLDLPAELLWVGGDLAPLVAEKDRMLADQKPRCRLIRAGVDRSDASQREAFLAESLARIRRVGAGFGLPLPPAAVADATGGPAAPA